MFSRRTSWNLSANAVAEHTELRRAAGGLLDLTDSNPTRCGLEWSEEELARALTAPGLSRYDPSPRGDPAARAAVAAYLAGRGAHVPVARILLTASTSESYALLLKLLCDPGDEVLAPAPSYPLLDLLAELEGARLSRYPLRFDGEWHLDHAAVAAAVTPRTRAVLVVSPGNPTGFTLSRDDLEFLDRLCADRGLALVADEVFADSALVPCPSVATARHALAFHLSGASKVCGVPQLKVAWIAVAGPTPLADAALERLDVLADTGLSVSGPAQLALPTLLARRESFLGPLRDRLATNRAALSRAASGSDAPSAGLRPNRESFPPNREFGVSGLGQAPFSVLAGGGGWAGVLRIGETLDEEGVVLRLLDEGVAVHPGFFYDFERPGHLVVSLLLEPEAFAEGIRRVAARLHMW